MRHFLLIIAVVIGQSVLADGLGDGLDEKSRERDAQQARTAEHYAEIERNQALGNRRGMVLLGIFAVGAIGFVLNKILSK